MASIIAMRCENKPSDPCQPTGTRYFAGVGEAKKEVKRSLRSWKEEGHWEMGDSPPIFSIQRWEVKTSKASLLEALRTGEVTAESVQVLECWTLDNANKLYSWKGWLTDEPDLLDEGE